MAGLIKEYEIRKYDVLLTHRKADSISPESWLLAPGIRFFTGCYYNHVDIIVEVEGKMWVMGAIAGGFMPHTPLDKWLAQWPKRREFAVLRYKGFEPAVVRNNINQIAGAKYDWNATLGDGFIDAVKVKFNKKHKWNQKKANSEKVNCSEAIAYIFDLEDSYQITPKDIFENKRFNHIFESRYLNK